MGNDDEQADGEGKGNDQGQHEMPALDFLSFVSCAAFGGAVQGLDAVDQRFHECGKAAQKGFSQQRAVGEAVPGTGFDADAAVGKTDGQRVTASVAHHHAFHDSLPSDERGRRKKKKTPEPADGGSGMKRYRRTGTMRH